MHEIISGMTLKRFRDLLDEGPPLRFYAVFRDDVDWFEVSPTPNPALLRVDYDHFALTDVIAYVVAYRDGEVLDCAGTEGFGFPTGLFGNDGPRYSDGSSPFLRRQVDNSKVRIVHAVGRMTRECPDHHSSAITNLSDTAIRVYKFGVIARGLFGLKDAGGLYYSPTQFTNWYRVNNDEGWIASGETVCDPDNWTCGNSVWAYFFESAAGKRFITTTVVKRPF